LGTSEGPVRQAPTQVLGLELKYGLKIKKFTQGFFVKAHTSLGFAAEEQFTVLQNVKAKDQGRFVENYQIHSPLKVLL